jgi:hypothetical protein
MAVPSLDLCLKTLALLGSALVALKLYRTGLYRRYPVFFSYFLFRIPNSIWPFLLDNKSDLYFKLWVITSPVVLLFYVLVVIELGRVMLVGYKGLYTIGRWALCGVSVVSLTISALTLIPKINPMLPQRSKVMGYVVATERGIETSLAIFVILLVFFISFFPIRLPRNVQAHAFIYPIFFLSTSLVSLLRTLFGLRMAGLVNTALYAVSVASMIGWFVLLSPSGEETPVTTSAVPREYEKRLLNRLDALNETLLRVSRH